MIKLFTDFAMGLFGHKLGGPAKVSVVSSALMGTITGSGWPTWSPPASSPSR